MAESPEIEKNYAYLFDTLNEAVLVADQNGIIKDANLAAAELSGYDSPESLIGQHMVTLYANPGDRDEMVKKLTVEGDSLKNFELLLQQKSGNSVWVSCNIRLIRNSEGEYIGTIGALRDISGQKKAEQALLQKTHEFEILLKGSQAVIENKDFLQTAKQIFNYCADTIGAKAGYIALLNETGQENEVIYLEPGGLTCNVNPNLPMPVRGLREVAYKSGETVFDNNYAASPHTQYMPEGHMTLKNVMFAPLKHDDKTIGLLGLAEKETDFNENDAKIATSFAELVSIALINSRNLDQLKKEKAKYLELNASKDKFFNIISHDLKSPISAIIGFSDLGILNSKRKKYDKVLNYCRIINEAAKQNLVLLNNILDWSRLQSGQMKFNPKPINLTWIIKEMLNHLTANAYQKNIQFSIDIPNDLSVFADKFMIETTIRNLASNAIKYTKINGQIKLSVKEEQNQALIEISDNGIGMSEEEMKNLFKIEHSKSKPGTEQEEGTGLGLILCKEFVEKHGGEILVESEVNKGSKFSFSIPKNIQK